MTEMSKHTKTPHQDTMKTVSYGTARLIVTAQTMRGIDVYRVIVLLQGKPCFLLFAPRDQHHRHIGELPKMAQLLITQKLILPHNKWLIYISLIHSGETKVTNAQIIKVERFNAAMDLVEQGNSACFLINRTYYDNGILYITELRNVQETKERELHRK